MKSRKLLSILLTLILIFISTVPTIAIAEEETIYNTRVAGNDRYGTSFAAADTLFNINGKYENIVLASGTNFPDALSGGYLAKIKNAPLMLINSSNEAKVLSYIRSRLMPGGTVYLLGGPAAISDGIESHIDAFSKDGAGYTVWRIWGTQRYTTNLAILEECLLTGSPADITNRRADYSRMEKEGLLVASGKGFADSLSASAAGKPLLLVGDTLSRDQIGWIATSHVKKFYIIGGEAAVSKAVETELKKYGSVERVAGSNRWETSYQVAKKFYPNAESIGLASGLNFPDGLSGAPVAMLYESPIVLVSNSSFNHAKKFVQERNIKRSVIIGGPAAISDATVKKIMEKDIIPFNPSDAATNVSGSTTKTNTNTNNGESSSGSKYEIPETVPGGTSYVLNINTGKFHRPGCKWVGEMKAQNRKDIVTTRDKVIEKGFDPCKTCKP